MVTSELKNTENSKRYTLKQYNSNGTNGDIVYRKLAQQPFTWTEYFHKSHMIVLNPQEFNRFTNQEQPRPDFLISKTICFKSLKAVLSIETTITM